MKKYIAIARVAGNYYMTTVMAESLCSAEHVILDKGICGRHTYGVEDCMAYDNESMKTDTFIASALSASAISFDGLVEIIEKRNAEIREKDAAEDRIREIEKQMKALAEELEAAKKILAV